MFGFARGCLICVPDSSLYLVGVVVVWIKGLGASGFALDLSSCLGFCLLLYCCFRR